jgi:heat shock protein HtpX
MPNAFATGRNPQNGAVAVTTGLMQMLNQRELEGVIAHELAHIKHYDTLISSVAASVAGAITFLADMAMWGMIFGGFSGDDEDGGGLADVVGGLLMLVLAPIAAMLVQMAISRTREFGADAGAADITGDPQALASALQKLEHWKHSVDPQTVAQEVNPATSHLYISAPSLGGLGALFSTHPPTEKRIEKLNAIARSGRIKAA